jgi:serine/threonine-protein kinase HipA
MIDFQQIQEANVYFRDIKAGTLFRKDNGCRFVYDKEYLSKPDSLPVSFTMPLTMPFGEEEYISENSILPFFDNLILEGWLLNVSEKTFKIEKSDRFSLLMATGLDTIGAIEIRGIHEGKEITKNDFAEYYNLEGFDAYEMKINQKTGLCPYCLDEISDGKLIHTRCMKSLWGFEDTPKIILKPDDLMYSFRLTIFGKSISGAQRKSIFAIDTKRRLLKPDLFNSSHIIKPQGDYAELPENEHLTMAIARKLKFDVPPIGLFNIDGLGNIFVIKRFDRDKKAKLHFEEFAMLTNQEANNKYLSSNEKIAKALNIYAEGPGVQLYEFFRRLLFCFITANGDMHLKNWALLENSNQNGAYRLAPVYDFLNTRIPIPNESDDIGLSLNGKKRNLRKKDFVEFAEERIGINKKAVNDLFDEIPEWLNVINTYIGRSELKESSKEKYYSLTKERMGVFTG